MPFKNGIHAQGLTTSNALVVSKYLTTVGCEQ